MKVKTSLTVAFAVPLAYENHRSSFATRPQLLRDSSFTRLSTKRLPFDSEYGNDIHHEIKKNKKIVALDYIETIRPVTLLQAVGAFWVGYLSLVKKTPSFVPPTTLIATSLSIFLSYGYGMLINDLMDRTLDSASSEKTKRPVAAGRITPKSGWVYACLLGAASLVLSRSNASLLLWTASNLFAMTGYAVFGWQKILLVKNLLCGWLAISPLVGASLLYRKAFSCLLTLKPLATVGFAVHVAREILKDIEDVEMDRGKKMTLPLFLGSNAWSHRIAFGIVYAILLHMILSPTYWDLFAPRGPNVYTAGVGLGTILCVRASRLTDVREGQRLLKKSIYVLLVGMISGLWIQ